MTARTAYREMRTMFDEINALYSPGSLPAPPTWSDDEIAYLDKWKKYIRWEKGNPLQLDGSALEQRVAHAYRRAIVALWLYPEVWVEGGLYLLQSAAHKDEGVQNLKQATDVLPKRWCIEYLESQKNLDEMCKIFDQLTTTLQQTIEDLQTREERALNKIRKRVDYHVAQHERAAGINKTATDGMNGTADSQAPAAKRARITQDPIDDETAANAGKGPIPTDDNDSDVDSVLSEADLQLDDLHPDDGHAHSDDTPSTTAVPDLGGVATHTTAGENTLFTELPVNTSADIAAYNRAVDKYRNQRLDLIRSRFSSQIEPLRRELSLAYIMYQRFLRRSKGTKPSRKLFSNISKSPHVTHHVFVASALLEYYFDKNTEIVGKIFQVGMNRF
ncbi:mRNA 3'-end-processing protein rna14, partial [Dispira parvispora]